VPSLVAVATLGKLRSLGQDECWRRRAGLRFGTAGLLQILELGLALAGAAQACTLQQPGACCAVVPSAPPLGGAQILESGLMRASCFLGFVWSLRCIRIFVCASDVLGFLFRPLIRLAWRGLRRLAACAA